MKQIFTFSSLLILLIHSSCISTHSGFIQSPSFSVKNDFKIVSTIEGKSEATYILGIGGNLTEGLVNEAKKNMYSNYKLQANQNLTNITTDIKRTYFILPHLFMSQNVLVSADVIQFYDNIEEVQETGKTNNEISKEGNTAELNGENKNLSATLKAEGTQILLGETVIATLSPSKYPKKNGNGIDKGDLNVNFANQDFLQKHRTEVSAFLQTYYSAKNWNLVMVVTSQSIDQPGEWIFHIDNVLLNKWLLSPVIGYKVDGDDDYSAQTASESLNKKEVGYEVQGGHQWEYPLFLEVCSTLQWIGLFATTWDYLEIG